MSCSCLPRLCLLQAIIQLLWPAVVELAQVFGEASPTAQEQALVIESAEILRLEVDASTVHEIDASTVLNHICILRHLDRERSRRVAAARQRAVDLWEVVRFDLFMPICLARGLLKGYRRVRERSARRVRQSSCVTVCVRSGDCKVLCEYVTCD